MKMRTSRCILAILCGIEFATSAGSKMSYDKLESGDEYGETV